MEGKILLQKTWCYRDEKDQALQWDDPLPKHLEEDFIKWTSLLKDVSTSKFPRYLFTELDYRLIEERCISMHSVMLGYIAMDVQYTLDIAA